MPTNSAPQWIAPFFTGVIATMAMTHLIPALCSITKNNKSKKKFDSFSSSSQTTNVVAKGSSSNSSKELMDSPSLDNRILRKAEAALQNRTSRLIIVVERCTNDHNYSAILRTAEALGIQHVYIIDPQACKSTLKQGDCNLEVNEIGNDSKNNNNSNNNDDGSNDQKDTKDIKLYRSTGQHVKHSTQAEVKDRAQHHLFAQRALEWLEVTEFETTAECIDHLRNEGYQIWATDLSQVAVCLTREALLQEPEHHSSTNPKIIPDKLAIVFGTEAVGCTAEMLNKSDKRVYLPLRGFADSLNLSVATALIIHQLFTLDPSIVGSMSDEERIQVRRKWYTKLASQRLQTKGQKQKRKRLVAQIEECSKIEWRVNHPESKVHPPVQPEQRKKIEKLKELKQELKEYDDELQRKSMEVVEDLVLNPPQPISDMRRADVHRTTYVGKNTKKNHGEAWGDMAATGYFRTDEATTSSFFRDRVKK